MTGGKGGGRFLIRCAALVPDASKDVIHDAAILVEDGQVQSVGPFSALRRSYPLAEERGDPGLVGVPGLIDAHSHGRGVPSTDHEIGDAPLEIWLARLTAATALDPYDQALVAGADLVATGVTGVQVFFHTFSGPEGYVRELGETARGLKDSGIGFELVLGISDRHELAPPLGDETEIPNEVARSLAFPERGMDPAEYFEVFDVLSGESEGVAELGLQQAKSAMGRSKPALGPIAPQWASEGVLRGAAARVQRGARAQTHLLERENQRSSAFGASPIRKLDGCGLLNEKLSVAHGVWLDDEEIPLLARCGTAVVHCPGSNTRLGAGTAPVRELLDSGVPVALGLDSNPVREPPDAFAEIRHARTKAAGAGAAISAREALALATMGGAAAVGRRGEVGVLRPGARADVVLLDLPEPSRPGVELVSLIVADASRGSVREVWIGGKPVETAGVAAARRRLWEALRRDAPRRRGRLWELKAVEPWLEDLWKKAGESSALQRR